MRRSDFLYDGIRLKRINNALAIIDGFVFYSHKSWF